MITIYDKDGNTRNVPLTKEAVHEQELMKSNFIRLSWNDRSLYTIPVGSYIMHEGVKYMLLDPYTPKQNRHKSFTYTPEFQHPIMWLGRIPFWHDLEQGGTIDRMYDFSIAHYPATIAEDIKKFINGLNIPFINTRLENGVHVPVTWNIAVDSTLNVTGVVPFNSVDILSAAASVANVFNCQYNFDYEARVFRLGNLSEGFALSSATPVTLRSGDNIGVASVSESKEDYHNTYYVQGSTRNLSKLTESGELVQVTNRLKLNPKPFSEGGNPDSLIYIGDNGQEIASLPSGVPMSAKSLIFDDVYPKYNLYLYNIREREVWLMENDERIETYPNDPNGREDDGVWYKFCSKWYFRLAYYLYEDNGGSIATETVKGKRIYWYDYDFTDDAKGKVEKKEVLPFWMETASVVTDIPFSTNLFTGPVKGDIISPQSVPYTEVQVKNGSDIITLGAFSFKGYVALSAELITPHMETPLNVNDRFVFVGGVDAAKFDDDHRDTLVIKDKVLSIAFQPNYDASGVDSPLTGYEFELVHFSADTVENQDNVGEPFQAYKGDYKIEPVEQNGLRVPTPAYEGGGGLYPRGASTPSINNNIGTLFNIAIDDEWLELAQSELKEKAMVQIAYYFQDLNKYSFPTDPVEYRKNPLSLFIGQRATYNNGQGANNGEDYELSTQIIKLVTRLDKPEITNISVGNEKAKGVISTMKEQIETIISGGFGTSEGNGGGITENQFLQLLITHGDKRYIRRDVNDETNTELTANKFIAKQEVKTNVAKSNNFFSDLLTGTGWAAWLDEHGKSIIEVDKLLVRMKAIFAELEIRKLSYSGGNLVFSAAGNKIVEVFPVKSNGSVAGSGDTVEAYRCCWLLKDGEEAVDNEWSVDDQSRCQSFNIREGVYQNVSNRYYWRKVLGLGVCDEDGAILTGGNIQNGKYNFIDLAAKVSGNYNGYSNGAYNKGCESNFNDIPAIGDALVQMGNQDNNKRERQNLVELVVNAENAPALLKYEGINDYSLDNKLIQGDYYENGTYKSYTYGDMYVGDKGNDPQSYIRFTKGDQNNGLLEISGRVNIKNGSNVDDSVKKAILGDIPDDIEAANGLAKQAGDKADNAQSAAEDAQATADGNTERLNNLSTGNNLLKNTGFRGQYTSREMENLALDSDTEMWSPSMEGWEYTYASAIEDQGNVSASGKLCRLSSGSIRQTLMFPVASGKDMVFSFKGIGTSVTLSIGGYTETISLSNEYETKTIRFKTSSTADRFELTGTALICELYLSEGSVAPSTWEPSPFDNPQAFAEMLTIEYLKSAIHQGSTTVLGGLILSNLIELGNYVNKQMREVTAGISGIYNNDEDVAFWGGGTFEQAMKTVAKFKRNPNYKPTDEEWQQMANFVVTHGGNAIFKGNIFADNGYFRGELRAASGTFDGYVKENFIKIEESDAELHTDGSAPYPYDRYYTINTNVNLEVVQGIEYPVPIREDNVKLPSDISYIGTHIRLYNAGWGVYGSRISGGFPTIISDYDILGVSFAMASGGMFAFPDKITFGGGLVELIGVKGDDNGTSICQWVVTNIQCRHFVPQKTQSELKRTLTCGDAVITFGDNEVDIKAYDDINQQKESAFVKLSYGTAQGRTIIGYEVGTTAARIEIASNGEIIATNGVDTPTVIVPARNS